jgi:hypothetical protein
MVPPKELLVLDSRRTVFVPAVEVVREPEPVRVPMPMSRLALRVVPPPSVTLT